MGQYSDFMTKYFHAEIYSDFDKDDIDGNKGLSFNEFQLDGIPLSMDAFNLLDRDDDNLVSKAELQYALELLAGNTPSS